VEKLNVDAVMMVDDENEFELVVEKDLEVMDDVDVEVVENVHEYFQV
jgi:hypothetical protein